MGPPNWELSPEPLIILTKYFKVEAETKYSLETEIAALFEKIVSLKPEFDQPILDCGADSVVIVEFVDQIEKKYQQDFEVEESTTLRDIARQIEQS